MMAELIRVIEKTIYALEKNKLHYNWVQNSSCNCGVFAQQLMGMDAVQLMHHISFTYPHINPKAEQWGNKAIYQKECSITGAPMSIVFSKLFEIGLSDQDIIHLENLSDKKILNR